MKCVILAFMTLAAEPAHADEAFLDQGYLFLGSAYERANGHTAQASTTYRILHKTDISASGLISHREEMGSFDLLFLVDCPTYNFSAHYDVNQGFMTENAVSFRPFPEWVEVRFPDGVTASIGSDHFAPLSGPIASDRFLEYVGNV